MPAIVALLRCYSLKAMTLFALGVVTCLSPTYTDAAEIASCNFPGRWARDLGGAILVDRGNHLIWALCIPGRGVASCRGSIEQKMFYDQISVYEGHLGAQQWRLPTMAEVTRSLANSPRRRLRLWSHKGFYWVQPPMEGSRGYAWYVFEPGNRLAEFGGFQFAAFVRLVMPCA
jgi:hypothetical protein